uniref:Glucose transport transcription regulator RGT1 n=1 Tax=Anthurium amnicola TaxID=1678845 RepID=A0A1D1Y816_9ARAE
MNRTKVTVACQACQKKKVKCTGSAPCTTCSRSGHKCIFSNNAKKRGPRNGNVEVIRTSAHRIEYVLQHYPSLRDQISQMLGNGSNNNNENNNNKRSTQSRQSTRIQSTDNEKIKGGLSSYPYLVPTKSKDDIPIKPQRRQDQFDRQDDHHQSPFFCKPLPVYPTNMQRANDEIPSNRSDINRYPQTGPLTSHSNISEIATTSSVVANNTLLQSIAKNMEASSIKDLTLPPPYTPSKRKGTSMSVYSSSLGTELLLPSPDLGMDYWQKSLINNNSKSRNENNVLEHGRILTDLNEMLNVNGEKEIVPSLPSPPSILSSPSPRSTSTNYCPPTPTSSSSPPLSPRAYTAKRSSIHLLSKPAPWCAYQENVQQNTFMETY